MTTPQGRLGRWGEGHARRFLEGKGYTVSHTNYRSRWGAEFGTPEESVTATKSQRLIATAQGYLQKNGFEQSPWRVDLISIHLDEKGKLLEVSHLENVVEE